MHAGTDMSWGFIKINQRAGSIKLKGQGIPKLWCQQAKAYGYHRTLYLTWAHEDPHCWEIVDKLDASNAAWKVLYFKVHFHDTESFVIAHLVL